MPAKAALPAAPGAHLPDRERTHLARAQGLRRQAALAHNRGRRPCASPLCITVLAQRWLRCLTSTGVAYGIRGRYVRGSELLDYLGGDGTGFGADLRERDPCRRLRGTVRAPAGRRDRHRRLQRDAGVLAAHRAAVDEPAAIWLLLGYGYA